MMSDRDPKFCSDFWRAPFKRMGVRLAMTAAYHPSASGQSERFVQTVEIALRCMIAEIQASLSDWDELLPDTEFTLNTSVNATTGISPFALLYGVHLRDGTLLYETIPEAHPAELFRKDRQAIRDQAADAMKLAQAKMAQYFDEKHSPLPTDKKMASIKLVRGTNKGYRIASSTVLDPIKTVAFPVKRRVGEAACELELPDWLKIHPVISITDLEPSSAEPDPYKRTKQPVAPIVQEKAEKYIVGRIIRKELRKPKGEKLKVPHYKVRWQEYAPRYDDWVRAEQLREDVPEIVEAFEQSLEEKAGRRARRRRS